MSITWKLRRWAEGNRTRLCMGGLDPYEVGAIADEIDAEHKRLTDKAHVDGERSAMKQVRSRSVDYRKGYEQAMKDMEERTKTEQNGVGITDELREFVEGHLYLGATALGGWKDAALAIADRIDERYSVKVERLEKYRATVSAMLKEYVKLPVDADGVPIHMGDSIEIIGGEEGTVVAIELYEDGWNVSMLPTGWDTPTLFDAESVRHVRPDTWERIIEDAMHAFLDDDAPAAPTKEELVERCKKLAGEAE